MTKESKALALGFIKKNYERKGWSLGRLETKHMMFILGVNQGQFAGLIGISKAQISKVLSTKYNRNLSCGHSQMALVKLLFHLVDGVQNIFDMVAL